MSLEKRVEQLELKPGTDVPVVWDIFLVGMRKGNGERNVIGFKESRGRGEWWKRDGETTEQLRQRASAEVDRSGPVAMFCEQYAD